MTTTVNLPASLVTLLGQNIFSCESLVGDL